MQGVGEGRLSPDRPCRERDPTCSSSAATVPRPRAATCASSAGCAGTTVPVGAARRARTMDRAAAHRRTRQRVASPSRRHPAEPSEPCGSGGLARVPTAAPDAAPKVVEPVRRRWYRLAPDGRVASRRADARQGLRGGGRTPRRLFFAPGARRSCMPTSVDLTTFARAVSVEIEVAGLPAGSSSMARVRRAVAIAWRPPGADAPTGSAPARRTIVVVLRPVGSPRLGCYPTHRVLTRGDGAAGRMSREPQGSPGAAPLLMLSKSHAALHQRGESAGRLYPKSSLLVVGR